MASPAQQKCLIHLIRDLNDELLRQPFDEELKELAYSFAVLLYRVIETVNRCGLRRVHLKAHRSDVDAFFEELTKWRFRSDACIRAKERFERNRDKLFTFLDHDGIPWNNNNAEHAIKAFARLRNVIDGLNAEQGIADYLILLSICVTCKYRGVDVLKFLRSGHRDFDRRSPPKN